MSHGSDPGRTHSPRGFRDGESAAASVVRGFAHGHLADPAPQRRRTGPPSGRTLIIGYGTVVLLVAALVAALVSRNQLIEELGQPRFNSTVTAPVPASDITSDGTVITTATLLASGWQFRNSTPYDVNRALSAVSDRLSDSAPPIERAVAAEGVLTGIGLGTVIGQEVRTWYNPASPDVALFSRVVRDNADQDDPISAMSVTTPNGTLLLEVREQLDGLDLDAIRGNKFTTNPKDYGIPRLYTVVLGGERLTFRGVLYR